MVAFWGVPHSLALPGQIAGKNDFLQPILIPLSQAFVKPFKRLSVGISVDKTLTIDFPASKTRETVESLKRPLLEIGT